MINVVEKEGLAVIYPVNETDGTIVPNLDHYFDTNLREDLLTKSKSVRLILYLLFILLQRSLVLHYSFFPSQSAGVRWDHTSFQLSNRKGTVQKKNDRDRAPS
jgi:hypothetical protein